MKEDVDYKELYLKEKIARIKVEMMILQKNYSMAQEDLESTSLKLEEYIVDNGDNKESL
jgi:hypothetical protein